MKVYTMQVNKQVSALSDQTTTRRQAFSSFFSTLGSISIANRLTALVGISTLGVSTSGCMGETTYDQGELSAYEPFWTYRADRLEQYQQETFQVGIRTMDAPGPHNAAVHHPIVSVQDGIINATVDHVMELDHWITTIYTRDLDTGRVFYLKEFHPTELSPDTEKGASISVELPPGILRIAVFAFCNKHELWWSGVIDLS